MKQITCIAAVCLLAFSLQAQLTISTVVQSFSGGDDVFVGPATAGEMIMVNTAQPSLKALGVEGVASGLLGPHEVGVWNSAKQLVAEVIVPSGTGGTFLNGAWWMNLATPLSLIVGQTYVLGAFYPDNSLDPVSAHNSSLTMAPGIGFVDAVLSSGSVFGYPDLAIGGLNAGLFGPNASFTAVPECSYTGMLVAIALGAFVAARVVNKAS